MNLTLGYRFKEWLVNIGLAENIATVLKIVIIIVVILALSYLAYIITKKIILFIIKKAVTKSKTKWDDVLLEQGFFNRLANLAPALVIYYSVKLALVSYPHTVSIIVSAIYIYLIIIGLLIIDSFLNALHKIYSTLSASKNRPIKSIIQLAKIIIYFTGFILILSIILNKSPVYFLSGLGALAAVLMLVFKDSILGFIAGIQLSANNMVRIGDWISMPGNNADGTIIEITLNTVKVKNWDQTISTIPIYSLVSDSFINWRGMEESGGRRIKRSISIDMKSVKFCTEKMLDKLKKIQLIIDYINDKQKEIKEFNKKHNVDESVSVNGRRLTNVGVFRKYVEEYLKQHPKIHNDMTFLVRQLQPTEKGLPVEIYVFSNDQKWANYEAIQSDIFDHILAIIPEFELKIFQNPTGDDFKKLSS
jgi:miniconductance mechanosensitive channel